MNTGFKGQVVYHFKARKVNICNTQYGARMALFVNSFKDQKEQPQQQQQQQQFRPKECDKYVLNAGYKDS